MSDSKEKLIQFFRDTNLVGTEKAEEFADHFHEKLFAKNDFFLQEGRISDEYLYLENGCLRSFAYDTEGNDITTNFSTGNQVVFEISSFFNRTGSKENIQALTEVAAGLSHTGNSIAYFMRYPNSGNSEDISSCADSAP